MDSSVAAEAYGEARTPIGRSVAGPGEMAARGAGSGRGDLGPVGPRGRRWATLERRGRVLVAEAACKVVDFQTLDTAWLASSARWLAGAATGGWEALVGEPPHQRAYRRIVASPHLEA